jgi:hypothetical protein
MSNISLFKQGNVAIPDYLRQADDTTKMLAGNSGGKQISIKGGVWRMIVGGEEVAKNEDRAMNFVIVAAAPKVHRTFFADKYEDGKVVEPTCWSADGVAPNEEVPAETRQSSQCLTCKQNVAGSGEGTSRACRYSRRIAVALENDLTGNVYRLQLPAKSIFGRPEGEKMPLDAYAKFLAGHNVPITGVVTEARFDTSEAVPVLKFRAVRPLQQDEWDAVQVQAKTDDALRAIEFKMMIKPKDGAKPAFQQAPAAPAAAPAAKAKPAPVAEPEDDIPEPVKRPSKKEAPVVPADNRAANVLDEWADDDAS